MILDMILVYSCRKASISTNLGFHRLTLFPLEIAEKKLHSVHHVFYSVAYMIVFIFQLVVFIIHLVVFND